MFAGVPLVGSCSVILCDFWSACAVCSDRLLDSPDAAAKATLVKQGQCTKGTEIKSLSACSAAAKYLNLQDASAESDGHHGVDFDPPFCYYEGGSLKFNSGNNRGSCSNVDQCLCVGSDNYVLDAAPKATVVKQGQCPKGTEIKSLSACSAAAKYLKLQDASAESDVQNGVRVRHTDPPFCYYEAGSLKFNGGGNTGST